MKMENIDGALVGGASLKAESFFRIANFNWKLIFWIFSSSVWLIVSVTYFIYAPSTINQTSLKILQNI
jgi:hypothetical protein